MKLRNAAAMAALAAAVVLGVAGTGAQATGELHPCVGAEVNPAYVAANDAKDGTVDGQVSYPEPRWYNEQQEWATPFGGFPGHHSEHVHGPYGCIPNAQTMSATYRLDLGYTFHNMQDYVVTAASESAVIRDDPNEPGDQGGSRQLWAATPEQVAELNAAAQASCPTCANNVQSVYFSATTEPPTRNAFVEIRGGLTLQKSGEQAVFLEWRNDPRWYETDAFPGLPSFGVVPSNQLAVRTRPQMSFPKAGDPTVVKQDYHHSGIGCDPAGTTQGTTGEVVSTTVTKPSYLWTAEDVAEPWAGDHVVCVRVTDGGGPAMLMIDPDFHHHYTAPTEACPNVDAAGNCLGKWYWQPGNARKEIISNGSPQNIDVTIPGEVIDSLGPGWHKLAFKSDDFPECVRNADFAGWDLCPPDARGAWSNISILPFYVASQDQPPSMPGNLHRVNPSCATFKAAWAASTDDVGVAGYRLYVDGALYATLAPSVLGLNVGCLSLEPHTIGVEAFDTAGNASPRSEWTLNYQPSSPYWTPSGVPG